MHPDLVAHLTPLDRTRFTQFGFGERHPVPFASVHAAFEHRARLSPDATAVEHLDRSISYTALDASANKLALQLRRLGVGPGVRVCLLVQRSIPMVVGILAVLKAGGAYVPLDGGIVTDSTLEHVIVDSRALLVLALRDFIPRIKSGSVLCLEDVIAAHANDRDAAKVEDRTSSSDAVYIIYTSGADFVHRSQIPAS